MHRVAQLHAPRRFGGRVGGRRAPHPAVVAARAAQVARTRTATRGVVDGVLDGVRTLHGMLASMLPEGWPGEAHDKQYSALLTLPPFDDCSFRLVAAPADWDDVMLVNLSVRWGAVPGNTYSLALHVHDFILNQVVRDVRGHRLRPA